MAKAEKQPYSLVKPIAEDLKNELTPFCDRIEIAGSLRRNEAAIGDIELVIIPKVTKPISVVSQGSFLFDDLTLEPPVYNITFAALRELAESRPDYLKPKGEGGERYKKYTLTIGSLRLSLDLFFCFPDNFGLIFLIRTGPAEFSKFMVSRRRYGGALPQGVYSENGFLHRDGSIIKTPDELSIFSLCGYEYLPPIHRSSWQSMLKQIDKKPDSPLPDGWLEI